MKNYFLFILLFLSVISCDTRKDIFKPNAEEVTGFFTLNSLREQQLNVGDFLIDSAKIHNPYRLQYQISASKNAKVLLSVKNPKNETIMQKEISNRGTLEFLAEIEGEYRIYFNVSDTYGQVSLLPVKVLVFGNLQPVAVLKTEIIKINNNQYSWRLDASNSYDLDDVYGGGVKTYLFQITTNGELGQKTDSISTSTSMTKKVSQSCNQKTDSISTSTSILDHLVNIKHQYHVRLTVYDAEGMASKSVTDLITVQ